MTFNLKSGNGPLLFKQMGSSPAKQNVAESFRSRVAKPITPKVTESAVSGTVEGGKMGRMKKGLRENFGRIKKGQGENFGKITKNLVPVEKNSTITDNTSMKPPYKKPVGPTAN